MTYKIHIKGLVQGVGFRPFIYRLAVKNQLSGTVENSNNGVFIILNIRNIDIDSFIAQIKKEAPYASKIGSIEVIEMPPQDFDSFSIKESQSHSSEITEISPDIAVCKDCIDDMKQQPHRIDYPFINCTNCGPRFSIINELPYDRAKTSMSVFEMCPACRQEYENIIDRRFHAQPIACKNCGPSYSLYYHNSILNDLSEIINKIAALVNSGKSLAIKGIGGFHLMCNAHNSEAVNKLREIKKRENKPFAVMCRDMETVSKISIPSQTETMLLDSWQRPIVLIKSRNLLASGVQHGLNTLGIMLPYMPIHYLLFEKFTTDTIVLTSGNFSDEPIIIDNEKAINQFSAKNLAVLVYNREIQNRTDDSVIQHINKQVSVLRRSRGYAPSPVEVDFNTEGVFAAGAELVNTFAIGKQHAAILSQYIGDLKNSETFDFYEETYSSFAKLFRFKPKMIACDMHPDYLSTKFAKKIALENGLPLTEIQHHHAHIASVMAEYQLNEKVIGICMDGIGLGTDGSIWGGEFMIADFIDFERLYHFSEIKIAGSDSVSVEPWRSAIAYLKASGNENYINQFIDSSMTGHRQKAQLYIQMLEKDINCYKYTSAGRLFDAVSALCGICIEAGFHAEAPMRLESILCETITEKYHYKKTSGCIDFSEMISEIVGDLKNKVIVGIISVKFHNTIVELIIDIAQELRKKYNLNKIVLSGGTFQNKYLAEKSIISLNNVNFEVYFPKQIPVNDGGIALGQLAIAATRLNSEEYKLI